MIRVEGRSRGRLKWRLIDERNRDGETRSLPAGFHAPSMQPSMHILSLFHYVASYALSPPAI